jgi:hypothetical protein
MGQLFVILAFCYRHKTKPFYLNFLTVNEFQTHERELKTFGIYFVYKWITFTSLQLLNEYFNQVQMINHKSLKFTSESDHKNL